MKIKENVHKFKSMSVLLKLESVPVLKENKKYAMHIFVQCVFCKDLFSKYLISIEGYGVYYNLSEINYIFSAQKCLLKEHTVLNKIKFKEF